MEDLEPIGGNPVEIEPADTGSDQIEQTEASQPEKYNFNPDNYGVTFRSERVVPKDRAHLEELLQLGHSYSANKEKFSTMETENARLSGQFQQYNELNNTLKEHPELAQQFETTYQNYMSAQNQAQPNQVNTELENRVTTMEQASADASLASEMTNLKAKFSTEDWVTVNDPAQGNLEQQLMQFMHKQGYTNPEQAYKSFRFDHVAQQAQFNGAKVATENIQKQHRAGVVAQGSATKPAVSNEFKGKTYDDAENFALQTLGLNN